MVYCPSSNKIRPRSVCRTRGRLVVPPAFTPPGLPQIQRGDFSAYPNSGFEFGGGVRRTEGSQTCAVTCASRLSYDLDVVMTLVIQWAAEVATTFKIPARATSLRLGLRRLRAWVKWISLSARPPHTDRRLSERMNRYLSSRCFVGRDYIMPPVTDCALSCDREGYTLPEKGVKQCDFRIMYATEEPCKRFTPIKNWKQPICA
jgi:hypothetical protein